MKRNAFIAVLLASVLGGSGPGVLADEGVAVIANLVVHSLDADTLKRIYTGRVIELDGQVLRPVNLVAGHPLRRRFLASMLQQEEDNYLAYWTVRRYIGKGAPPRELATTAEVLEFVRRTPGALGYVDAAEVGPGVSVMLRK
jgi:ABC-type phosphate transport system substrate-binding protein